MLDIISINGFEGNRIGFRQEMHSKIIVKKKIFDRVFAQKQGDPAVHIANGRCGIFCQHDVAQGILLFAKACKIQHVVVSSCKKMFVFAVIPLKKSRAGYGATIIFKVLCKKGLLSYRFRAGVYKQCAVRGPSNPHLQNFGSEQSCTKTGATELGYISNFSSGGVTSCPLYNSATSLCPISRTYLPHIPLLCLVQSILFDF